MCLFSLWNQLVFVNQNLPLCLWRCCGFSNIDNFHFIRNRSCKCYRNHYHHNTDRNRESNFYELGIQKEIFINDYQSFFSLFKTFDAESFSLRFGIVSIDFVAFTGHSHAINNRPLILLWSTGHFTLIVFKNRFVLRFYVYTRLL